MPFAKAEGMKKLLLAFFTIFATACQDSATNPAIWDSGDFSVIGGEIVPVSDTVTQSVLAIYMRKEKVSVDLSGQVKKSYSYSSCTASAIHPRIVLTAAHCATDIKDKNSVVTYYDKTNQRVVRKVIDKAIHQEFFKLNDDYDVALLLLDKALPTDFTLAQLANEKTLLENNRFLAVGFGRQSGLVSEAHKNDGKLRKVELEALRFSPKEPVIEVYQGNGKGVCKGDSGGPAFIFKNGKPVVIGVVSGGRAKDGNPYSGPENICDNMGRYMNVPFHLDWIQEKMAQLLTTAQATGM